MDDFLIYLRAWLCLIAVAVVLVGTAWYTDRRDSGESRRWKPTEAYILDRRLSPSEPHGYERLTVGFQTWRGHPALLIADVPADHAPSTDQVWVLYHPLQPHRARLTLDPPDEM